MTPDEIHAHDRLFIGGTWVEPSTAERIAVTDPATEALIGRVPAGQQEDVDRAVAAARAALGVWSATSPAERAVVLRRIADGLDARKQEMAELVTRELGMPLHTTQPVQVDWSIETLRVEADNLEAFSWREPLDGYVVVQEPRGVIAAVTPWNFPLDQVISKMSPALAAGCTVVLKPSEIAPLCTFLLAEVLAESGLPAGAFNIVTGTGPVAGEALVGHPDVDMISFTGSVRAGRRVAELASRNVKPVTLELGGKSANIILDDADLEAAVAHGVADCYLNSGQTCNALTRMLVSRDRLAEAEQIAAKVADTFTPGDPFAAETKIGPLISETQRERVRGYIRTGVEEGAKLVTGGEEAPDGLDRGHFVRPTVFSEVSPEMTIAQEEIFGPVLVILPFEDEADAVRIANGTPYGLAGAVWTEDPERAERVAGRLLAGQVYINGAAFNAQAPFGGYKQSGYGREHGPHAIHEFLQAKALVFNPDGHFAVQSVMGVK